MITKVLDAEEFNTLLRCLLNLRECNDVEIKDGIVRQRSNDRTSIFEMDMTSILDDMSFSISNLKKKIELFKMFSGNSVTISVVLAESESESYYTISDDDSSVKFNFPSSRFIDNKFMNQEEIDAIFNMTEDDIFLNTDIKKKVTDRIKIVTDIFNTPAIQIRFDNDQAALASITQSKDQFAELQSNIISAINFEGKYYTNLPPIPFCIDYDTNLMFKMYKKDEESILYNTLEAELNSVKIKIYTRTALIEDTEEE